MQENLFKFNIGKMSFDLEAYLLIRKMIFFEVNYTKITNVLILTNYR